MFGFKKHASTQEETTNQPTVAAQPTTDELSQELLDNVCGYTPENYKAPDGLFRKPTPEDLI